MSTLDNISSVDMLECLITKDPRWCWILDEWEASSDDKLLTLSETVHRFRENFVKETANLVSKALGDIEGPNDVKKYTEQAAREGTDTRTRLQLGVSARHDIAPIPSRVSQFRWRASSITKEM
eukprot:COSAG04_NODE_12965_length_626_cov_0.700190_1_plen_123_part_00